MASIGTTMLHLADTTRDIEWRKEDMILRQITEKQRVLENRNRAVDVKCSQLRTVSELSALLAGFTMVMFVELTIPPNANVWLVFCFGLMTALTIMMMVRAMVGCALLLVGILYRSATFADRKTFLQFWLNRCEEKWKRLFMTFIYGVPVFIIDLAIMGWIKFTETATMWPAAVPVTVVCIFGISFWVVDQCSWGKYLIAKRPEDARTLDIETMQYGRYPDGGGGSGGWRRCSLWLGNAFLSSSSSSSSSSCFSSSLTLAAMSDVGKNFVGLLACLFLNYYWCAVPVPTA